MTSDSRERFVREYRVTKVDPRHADLRRGTGHVFRDDDPTWIEWVGEQSDYDVEIAGLRGVEGIAEATAREMESEGAKDVRIEVREVTPWKLVNRALGLPASHGKLT